MELETGLNILVGPNGAGKTTVLEAASLVLQGTPLRTSNVRDVMSRDRDHLRVEVELSDAGGAMWPRPPTAGTASAG